MSMGKSIQQAVAGAIANVAPTLARELIPGAPLAGRALREISQVLTGQPDAPPERLEAAVKTLTPEQATALEALELQRTERERIRAADRANARDRQSETGDWTPAVLAGMAFIALIGVAAALFVLSPQGDARDILMIIVGALVTMAKQGYDFFLGSSRGSKEKTALMASRR